MIKKTTIFLIIVLFTSISAYCQEKKSPNISLHLSVLQNNLDFVKQHIEADTDLNKKDQYGSTPLIIAATFGRNEIALLQL